MKTILFLFGMIITINTSCQKNNYTPRKYKNRTSIASDLYLHHVQILSDTIRSFILSRSKAFHAKENDSLTEVIIDTVLYGPQKDKLAFFIITMNTDDKLLGGGSKSNFHFNAYCFLGLIENGSIDAITWLSAYNLSRYTDLKQTSERIREIYFKELGGELLKYNLDDVRFWDDSNWRSVYNNPFPTEKFESP